MPVAQSSSTVQFQVGQTWRTNKRPASPAWLVTQLAVSGGRQVATLERQGRPENYKGPGSLRRGPEAPKGWVLVSES
jgi:hypothetical protein